MTIQKINFNLNASNNKAQVAFGNKRMPVAKFPLIADITPKKYSGLIKDSIKNLKAQLATIQKDPNFSLADGIMKKNAIKSLKQELKNKNV